VNVSFSGFRLLFAAAAFFVGAVAFFAAVFAAAFLAAGFAVFVAMWFPFLGWLAA
jgi:hypothetical protein